MIRRGVLLAAVMTMLAAVVQAYPNLNATTGILAVPTAETLATGQSVWAGDILFFEDTVFNGRFVYGLSPQLEVGAGVILGNDTGLGINGKYRTGSMIGGFDWAVGATLQTGDEIGDGWQIYFAGTRNFGITGVDGAGLSGTIGVSFTDIEKRSAFRPFVGAQLRLATATEVDAEFVLETGDFNESIFSLLVRQRLTDRLSGELGLTNAMGFTGIEDHDFFLGLAYGFGS